MRRKAFFNPPSVPAALNEYYSIHTIDINHMIYFLIFTLMLAQAIAGSIIYWFIDSVCKL